MKRLFAAAAATACLLAVYAPLSAEPVTHYSNTDYRDGGVVLRLSEPMGTVYNPGQVVSFKYQSRQDGYVIVFNIDSEGFVHVLSPGGEPVQARANRSYTVPADGSQLLVGGETGVEFIFAVFVPERVFIDDTELAYLRDQESGPVEQRYRVEGDPFLAANVIAGDLIRGISRRDGIFFDYTYFFINQRVAYPCYLCGTCDGDTPDPICADNFVEADFDRDHPLRYPLRRAYAIGDAPPADEVVADDTGEVVADDDVDVAFYPYSVEVRYISRPWWGYDWYWYDSWCFDPFYSGWYYDPYCYNGWGWNSWCGVGWGWGYWPRWGWQWGWGCGGWYAGGAWSGYYCSGNDYYWRRNYISSYNDGNTFRPARYKSGGDLVQSRLHATSRDNKLRIATRSVRTKDRNVIAARYGNDSRTVAYKGRSSVGSLRDRYNRGRTARIRDGRTPLTQKRQYRSRDVITPRNGHSVTPGKRYVRPRIDRGKGTSRTTHDVRKGTRTRSSTRKIDRSRSTTKNRSSVRSNSSNRSGSSRSKATSRSSSSGSKSKASNRSSGSSGSKSRKSRKR